MADSHTTWYTFPAKLQQWTWQFHFADKSLVRSKGPLKLYPFDGPMHYADTFSCIIQFSEQYEMQQARRLRCKFIWKQTFMLVICVTSHRSVMHRGVSRLQGLQVRSARHDHTLRISCFVSHICPFISSPKVCDGFRWKGARDVDTGKKKKQTNKQTNFISVCPKIYI